MLTLYSYPTLFGVADSTEEATARLVRKLAEKYERLTFCYARPG